LPLLLPWQLWRLLVQQLWELLLLGGREGRRLGDVSHAWRRELLLLLLLLLSLWSRG
jgi:hypothetical protein